MPGRLAFPAPAPASWIDYCRCLRCGLIFTAPLLLPLARRFHPKLSGKPFAQTDLSSLPSNLRERTIEHSREPPAPTLMVFATHTRHSAFRRIRPLHSSCDTFPAAAIPDVRAMAARSQACPPARLRVSAWGVMASGAAAKESGTSVSGRPESGHTLSRFLFPLTVDDEDVPEEPIEAPPVSATITASNHHSRLAGITPATASCPTRRGRRPPGRPAIASAVQHEFAGNVGAGFHSREPAGGDGGKKFAECRSPTSGVKSLWAVVPGNNAPP